MPFDPLRSQKEALEREQRLALLAERRGQVAALTSPADATMQRFRNESAAGESANGIGGGIEDGPQLRAIARAFLQRKGSGTMQNGRWYPGFSADNPYVANASSYIGAGAGGFENLGEIALGRAANDAFAYDLASRALDERLKPLGRPRALT